MILCLVYDVSSDTTYASRYEKFTCSQRIDPKSRGTFVVSEPQGQSYRKLKRKVLTFEPCVLQLGQHQNVY